MPLIAVGRGARTAPPSAPGFVAPNAPTGVSAAQGSPTSSVIRVTFTPGTDANDPAAAITANKLYGASSSGGTFTLVATLGAAATFGDETGIPVSTQRFYKVSTVNEHGLESALSAEVNATTAAGGGGTFVEPRNFTLELIAPRAAGTAPSADEGTPNFPSGHRCLKAYTGITYSYRCDAIGGSFPYVWSIADAAAGMSINSSTGVITWTNPTANATPTITCTDAEGTAASGTPTIVVTTSGFKFVDAVSGSNSNAGTLAAPWQTFAHARANSSAGDIIYFRAGTYSTNLTPDNNGGKTAEFTPAGNWARIEISSSTRSVRWIAYPGEVVVFDGGYVAGVSQGVLMRITGSSTNPVYIDGIEFRNYYHMVFQLGIAANAHYDKFCNCNVHDMEDSIDGANSAGVDSLSNSGGSPRYYTVYQSNNFHDNFPGGVKMYWQYKSLQEFNQFVDNGGLSPAGNRQAAGPDHKAGCGRFEVRCNTYRNLPGASDVPGSNSASNDAGFGGNMNTSNAVPAFAASGEVRYNKFGGTSRPDLRVVDMNNFSNAGAIFIYRNTGIGRWNVQNSGTAGTGLFTFYRNVIMNDVGVNDPDRITVSSGDRSRIATQDNLTGASGAGFVDANLDLTGASLTSFGPTTATPRGAQYA